MDEDKIVPKNNHHSILVGYGEILYFDNISVLVYKSDAIVNGTTFFVRMSPHRDRNAFD